MKQFKKVVAGFLATLMLASAVLSGSAVEVEAAKYKKAKTSKQLDGAYYSKYSKTSKVRITVKTPEGTQKYTFKKSKINSEVKRLGDAMKKGLKSNPKAKFTYSAGSGKKKFTVTLTINKKKGTFAAKKGSKTIFSKKFTFKKLSKVNGKKVSNAYTLQNKEKTATMTLRLVNSGKKHFFRLFRGTSVARTDCIARFGTTTGKYVFAMSKIPYFFVTKMEYK